MSEAGNPFETFGTLAVDDMMATISREREKCEVILSFILPMFKDCQKVRVMLETVQESIEEIYEQEARWAKLVKTAPGEGDEQ